MSALLLFGQTAPLIGNPTGGQVVAGGASISNSGTTLTVNQTTQNAVINWQNFSIASGELTKFVQPSVTSAALNRVISGNPSAIYGTLSSNGLVYLINPNGILVGPGGVVNTAGFIASTRDISNQDFLSNNLHFTGSSDAGVKNLGTINASGGDIYLIGNTVNNGGAINAPQGTVGLAAGDDVLMTQAGDDNLFVQPNANSSTANANRTAIQNSGKITAASAQLKAANGNMYALAINNSGTIVATTVKHQGGHIFLMSDSGTVVNSGTLDASATIAGGQGGTVTIKSASGTAIHRGRILARGGQGGAGGKVDISGSSVELGGTVDTTAPGGTTGSLLIDPATLDVISGGSTTSVTASTVDNNYVSTLLGTNNLTLNADTNITVSDTITWNAATTLTLSTNTAGSTIDINAPISGLNGGLTINTYAAGDVISATANVDVASFILQSGYWQQNSNGGVLPDFDASQDFELQGSSTFLRVSGGDGTVGNPYQIIGPYDLQGIGSPSGNLLNLNFKLANDIDASGTATWNAGAGFVPIGGSATPFTGTLDGGGFSINGLTINTPNASGVGLFGNVFNSGNVIAIENLGLTNVQVTGDDGVGALAGFHSGGTITNVYSSGNVTANDGSGYLGFGGGLGGLVGMNVSGTITNSHTAGTVTGGSSSEDAGGLVGYNSGTISDSYSTATVRGDSDIGGLVSFNSVSGGSVGTITNSYSAGAVTGTDTVGGLVGDNYAGSSISNSYSTGAVSAQSNVGGLVGVNDSTISNAYSTGMVTGTTSAGGLVGYNYTSSGVMITNSFWDTVTAGSGVTSGVGSDATPNTTPGVMGDPTATLLMSSTYSGAGWSIGTDPTSDTWVIFNGQTRPMLSMEYSTNITNAHQLQLIGLNATTLAANYTLAGDVDASGTTNASDIWATSTTNGGSGFLPIGNSTSAYTGTFDGAGYAIDALTINLPSANLVGLWSNLGSGATVKNVALTNAKITGYTNVAGLVASNSGMVSDSSVTGLITTTDFTAGGLVAYNAGAISDSYSGAAVMGSGSGNSHLGGLVGTNVGSISNSYSTGSVSGTGAIYVGGLSGSNETGATITNCYSTGALTGSSLGGLTAYNGGTITNSFWDITTSGQSTSADGTGDSTATLVASSTYSGAGWSIGTDPTSDTWVIFNGQTRPILSMEYSTNITNAHQLQLIGLNATTLAANYTLAGNVDASGTTNASDIWATSTTNGGSGFVPIGNSATAFSGTFNGEGHTVNGLYIIAPMTAGVGLFGLTGTGAVVQNVGLTNVNVTGYLGVGALVGENSGIVATSYATGTVSGETNDDYYIGGLVGYNGTGGAVETSHASATVSGYDWVGGLVGYNLGTVQVSYSGGVVSGVGAVGGLVGGNFGMLETSYATGQVSGAGDNVDIGGLVGENDATVETSYATGAVSGYNSVGGLIGTNSGTVETTYSIGSVSSTAGSTDIGGLIGQESDGTVQTSYWAQDTGLNVGLYGIGSSSSNIGATPETIASLKQQATFQPAGTGVPNWGFTSTWTTLGDTNTPQIIALPNTSIPTGVTMDSLSGTAFSDSGATFASAGLTIDLIYDGGVLQSTTTNGSGGFSFSNVSSTDLTGGVLLTDAHDNGDTFFQANNPATTIASIDIWGGTLRISADSASNAALKQAAGSLSGINYTVTGTALATSANINMDIVSGYTLDGNITTNEFSTEPTSMITGSQDVTITASPVAFSGNLTISGALIVASTNGTIDLVNETMSAKSVSLSTGLPVDIANSSITTAGGNIDVSGNGKVNALGTGFNDGIDIFDSTLDAQGGNISLAGVGGYSDVSGTVAAGFGVSIGTDGITSTSLTTTGSGNISIHGTFNQNITSSGYFAGVTIYNNENDSTGSNTLSVGSGALTIVGTVSQGKANGTEGNAASIGGIEVGEGTSLQATGNGGAISLTGNTSGATSLIQPGAFSFIQGIEVSGNLSIASDGSVALNGTSGTVNASNSTLTDATGDTPYTYGVITDQGMTLTTGSNSTVTITGTSGAVVTTGAYTGGSRGVDIESSNFTLGANNMVGITGQSGAVNAGNGAVMEAGNAAETDGVRIGGGSGTFISLATGGSFSVTGIGGTLNTSGTTADPGDDLPGSSGVNIGNGADISAIGNSTVTVMGTAGALNSGTGKVGSAVGVLVSSDSESTTTLSSQNGGIRITGQAGSASNLGIGVIVIGTDGGTTTIDSGSGNITINGVGGSGNAGPGTYTGFYEANYGVFLADAATVETNAGGDIQFTGTGGSNSAAGVAEVELAGSNEIDSSPVVPQIDSSGPASFTSLSGSDVDITSATINTPNATFTVAGNLNITGESIIAFGGNVAPPTDGSGYVNIMNGTTATATNATLTSNGPLFLNSSNITLSGGSLTGSGTGFVAADNSDETDGIDIFNTTINAQGGNINLTGVAGYSDVSETVSGGIGIQIGNDGSHTTTIETSGSGNVTLTGSFAQNISSETNIQGFSMDGTGNTISVASGLLTITGTVSAGATGSSSSSSDASGIQIGDGAVVEATANGGSILMTGNSSGSTSFDSATGSSGGSGIEIGGDSGSGAMISVAANGSITLHGTGGEIDSSFSASIGDTGNASGIELEDGMHLTAGTGSTISLTGQGGASVSSGLNVGGANGVDISDDDSAPVMISVATGGSISITGTGGTVNTTNSAPTTSNDVPGVEGVSINTHASVTASGSSTISIMGTGGTVTAGTSNVGDAIGVGIGASSTSDPGPTTISSASGAIQITGHGGTTPNLGTGVVVYGFSGELASITSTSGNITVNGTGGSGYTGSGVVSGYSIPSAGVAVVDDSKIQTGGSGTISLTGTGGNNSRGIYIEEFPSGSFDPDPTNAPTLTSGGALTINALSGTGIYLNGTLNAASATIGTGTTGNFASITSGSLDIESSMITLTGGNFTAFGKGNANSGPSGIYMDVNGGASTINAAGGNIALTGEGIAVTWGGMGFTGDVAGEGLSLNLATLETSGTGGITVVGDDSVGSGVTVQNALLGVQIDGSTLSTVNGAISITGTVNSGTALTTSAASGQGLGGDGVQGVDISYDDMSTVVASVIQDTGTAGSISIIGNTAGSTADASDTTSDSHDNEGVHINGNGTAISSAGNGGSANGILIQATGGALISNQLGGTGGSQGTSDADGLSLGGGATIQATNAAKITLMGQGGTNSTVDNAVLGGATGILIKANGNNDSSSNGNILLTSASGNISFTGTGGTSPNAGAGVAVNGKNGATVSITSTTGAITMNGTGAAGNTQGLLNSDSGGDGAGTQAPNIGVAIIGNDDVQTGGAGGISLTGAGAGVNGSAIYISDFGQTTGPSLTASSGPLNLTSNIASGSGGDIILSNSTLPASPNIVALNAAFDTQGEGAVLIQDENIQLGGGNFTVTATALGTTQSIYTTGVEIIGSTINSGGGNISVTGQAAYLYDGTLGGYVAGEGVYLDSSILENASPSQSSITSGNITINGNGSIGTVPSPVTVLNILTGTEIQSSTVSVTNGALSITGQVNSGYAESENSLNYPNAPEDSDHDGPVGVTIHDGSTVEAIGTGVTGGSVAIVGNASGSVSDLSETTGGGDNIGVHLTGGTGDVTISVAGGTTGITITGTGGALAYGSAATTGGITDGIDIFNGVTITAASSAPIMLTGTGGTNTPASGQVVGGSLGVIVMARTADSTDPTSTVSITSASGAIQITGTGGSSPISGEGVMLLGSNGGTVSVTSGAGNITLMGTGGPGNSGQASTSGGGALPNTGVSILDGTTVASTSGNLILTGSGAGAGLDGIVLEPFVGGSTTSSSSPVINAAAGSLTLTSTAGGIIYDATGASASPVVGSSVMFNSASSIGIDNAISSSNGSILMQGQTITLNAAVSSTGGNTTLVDTQQFINNAGAGALSASGGHSWQVWSVNPAGSGQSTIDNDNGLLPNFIQYNATYGVTTPAESGDGLLYSYSPAPLAITLGGSFTKTYDGTLNLTIASGSYSLSSSGLLSGDSIVTTAGALNGILNSKDVATATTVTVTSTQIEAVSSFSRGGIPVFGYTGSSVSGAATVTPAMVTAGLTGTVEKTYDGTTAATLTSTNYTLGGVVLGDVANLNDPMSGTYDTANVGTGKTVTVSGLAISGASAGDYTLAATTINGAVGQIDAASLTVVTETGVAANNKVYDATTNATLDLTSYSLSGVMNGDAITIDPTGYTATFATKNVGNNIAVTVSNLGLSGTNAGNYTLTQPNGLTANITPASLTITGAIAGNKIYDGTVAATLSSSGTLNGVISGDSVALNTGSASATFAGKDVGNDLPVTVTGDTLTGTDSGNYALTQPTGLAANITPATLTAGLTGTVEKTYDGTTAATLTSTNYTLGGVVSGDVANLNDPTSGTYDTANVGTGKTVTVSGLAISGASAGDYTLAATTINGAVGQIDAASLTVVTETGVAANNKVYDATTNATLDLTSYSLSGVMNGDAITIDPTGYTATFATKNVGNNIAVTVSNLGLSGTNAGNYTLTQPNGLTANITPASLTIIGAVAGNKVYDGTVAATLSSVGALNGVVPGDTVAINPTGYTASFAAADVGNTLAVTVSNLSLSGADSGNYTLTQPTGLTANITPASLTITGAVAASKVYDSTTADTLTSTGSLSGVLGEDDVTLDSSESTASFSDKNVGSEKAVSVTGYVLGGTSADNYTLAQPSGLTANITPATLTVTGISAEDKVYDGTTSAMLDVASASLQGILGDDSVAVASEGSTADFANPNVGVAIPVTVSHVALSGADQGNYTVTPPNGLTADITAAPIVTTPPPVVVTPPAVTVIAPINQQPPPQVVPPQQNNNPGDQNNVFLPVSYSPPPAGNQTGTPGSELTGTTGNSGTIASGDVAQLNNGGLSNVSNPVAAGALNQALGPAVFTALTDALQAADNWADINTNALPTDTSAPAASGDETILGAGDVVSVQNHQVTNIPLSQAPEPLQEALGNGVMNGLQSGTGH